MAQKVQVSLIDDLDGTSEADETVSYGLDGKSYEIDLTKKNAAKLRKILEKYSAVARKATPKGAAKGGAARSTSSREHTQAIREWAKQNGKPVNERGRIPAAIVAEYDAAQAVIKG